MNRLLIRGTWMVLAAAVLIGVLWTARAGTHRLAALQGEVRILQDRVRRLSYNTASGGGVNLKLMPDPVTGAPTVPLEEVFSFDRNHAICRVDTNPRAFRMRTFKLGEVVIEPHKFFMTMVATSVEQYRVTTRPDGTRRVTMRGGLSCATEVGQAKVTLGSRTAAEHATYLIEAVDGGIGGGKAGDAFAFTVFFDPKDAPVNYRIFGPRFTFTGKMVDGEITITDPRR
ncbi:MAG: hypothetical protein ACT4P5_08010 [Armatimonadota bacterium]